MHLWAELNPFVLLMVTCAAGEIPHVSQFCVTEQADDLSLTSGEIVYLLEKIDAEWYRGKCRNRTGVFPANHVRVIVSGFC